MTDYRAIDSIVITERLKKDHCATEVYRGVDVPDGTFKNFVFVNALNTTLKGGDEFVASTIKHFDDVKSLDNEHIGKTLRLIRKDGTHHIVCQFEHGEFLQDIMGRSREEGITFSPDHILTVVSRVLSALIAGKRRGIIHGFVTPQSILVTYEGQVRLYNFASSQFIPKLIKNNPNAFKSAEGCLHPEVLRTGKFSEKFDIFSLGLVIFRMLTGKSPIENGQLSDNLSQIIDNINMGYTELDSEPAPDEFKQLLKKSLIQDDNSYKSYDEFYTEVNDIIQSDTYSATTFNLAFFVHSMFREKSEESAKKLEMEKKVNYSGYLSQAAEEYAAVSRKPGRIVPVLVFLIVVVACVVSYLIYESKKIEREKQEIALKAKNTLEKMNKIEEEKQNNIDKLKEEMENKMKEMMEKANSVADSKVKEELLKIQKEEEEKYKKDLLKLENEKRRIQQEKVKQLTFMKDAEESTDKSKKKEKAVSDQPSVKKKPEPESEQKKITVPVLETKTLNKAEEIKTEDEFQTEPDKPIEQVVDKKVTNEDVVKEDKKEPPVPEQIPVTAKHDINLIKNLSWEYSFSNAVITLNTEKSVENSYIEIKGQNRKIEFNGVKKADIVSQKLAEAFTDSLIEFSTYNKQGKTFINPSDDTLILRVSDVIYNKLPFKMSITFTFNRNLPERQCTIVDNYLLPLEITEIQMTCEIKGRRIDRKGFEKNIMSLYSEDYYKIKTTTNRKSTKHSVISDSGNMFEYYYDLGTGFTGTMFRLIFTKSH